MGRSRVNNIVGARQDFDKLHEWFNSPRPVVRVLFYVFLGSSLAICLVFSIWGASKYQIFGLVNGAILLVFVIDHFVYLQRRGRGSLSK